MKKLFAILMLIGLSACGMNQTAVFIKDAVKTVQKNRTAHETNTAYNTRCPVERRRKASQENCKCGAPQTCISEYLPPWGIHPLSGRSDLPRPILTPAKA